VRLEPARPFYLTTRRAALSSLHAERESPLRSYGRGRWFDVRRRRLGFRAPARARIGARPLSC
jgi:hypothetical protein